MGHWLNTRRNKCSQVTLYQRFCKTHNLNEIPADKWQLCRYAVYTAEHVNAHRTVKNYVGAVRSMQELAGVPTPAPGSPNMKLMLQGI